MKDVALPYDGLPHICSENDEHYLLYWLNFKILLIRQSVSTENATVHHLENDEVLYCFDYRYSVPVRYFY